MSNNWQKFVCYLIVALFPQCPRSAPCRLPLSIFNSFSQFLNQFSLLTKMRARKTLFFYHSELQLQHFSGCPDPDPTPYPPHIYLATSLGHWHGARASSALRLFTQLQWANVTISGEFQAAKLTIFFTILVRFCFGFDIYASFEYSNWF